MIADTWREKIHLNRTTGASGWVIRSVRSTAWGPQTSQKVDSEWILEKPTEILSGVGGLHWEVGTGSEQKEWSAAQNCLTHVITIPNLVPGRDNYQQPKEQVNILRVNTAHP